MVEIILCITNPTQKNSETVISEFSKHNHDSLQKADSPQSAQRTLSFFVDSE